MRRTQTIVSFPEDKWSDELEMELRTLALNHDGEVGKSWTTESKTPPPDRRREDKAKRDAAVAELVAGHMYRELLLMKRAQEKREWSGEETRRLRMAVQQHPGIKEYKVSLLDRHYSGEEMKDIAAAENVTRSYVAYVLGEARRYLTSPCRRDHPVRKKHAEKFRYYDDDEYEYRETLPSTEELDAFQSMPDFEPSS